MFDAMEGGLLAAVGRAGVLQILEALEENPTGLHHKELRYDVVKKSSFDTALRTISRHSLAAQAKSGGPYYLTPAGLRALDLCRRLLQLEEEIQSGHMPKAEANLPVQIAAERKANGSSEGAE
jgi:hypothetical protein